MQLRQKRLLLAALVSTVFLGTQACSDGQKADSFKDDAVLTKFAEWHLGFTTNAQQRDQDLAAEVTPRWGLSELRFQRIWRDREDGYWLYYETSQPDVRPDRNQIWHLYRNEQGSLKIDAYNFNDLTAGLEFWGKGSDPKAFDTVSLGDLTTTQGCNATYTWNAAFERFIGVNPHQECYTIGKSYLVQQIELSETADGTLVRNDWHTFFGEDGVSKRGSIYKSGTFGPTVHLYTERYGLE